MCLDFACDEGAYVVCEKPIYVIILPGQVKRMRRSNNCLICGFRLDFCGNLGSISFTVIEMCDSLTLAYTKK